MYFDSWTALWAMAGHGAYVWSAYGITTMVLLWLVWQPLRRRRHLLRWLRNRRHHSYGN